MTLPLTIAHEMNAVTVTCMSAGLAGSQIFRELGWVAWASASVRNKGNGPLSALSDSVASHWRAGCQHQVVSRFADRDLVGALGDAPVAGDSVGPVEACQQPSVACDGYLA